MTLAIPVPTAPGEHGLKPFIFAGVVMALVLLLGLWAGWSERKMRRAPVTVQEARIREVFLKPRWGPPSSIGIDLHATGLPHERIKEIAAEYGYDFEEHVKNRNTNALRFKPKRAS
jgi:hypothetical protein